MLHAEVLPYGEGPGRKNDDIISSDDRNESIEVRDSNDDLNIITTTTTTATATTGESPSPPHLWSSVVRLCVQEGKHRMVRRMLHNVGHSVLQLKRVRFGGLTLGGSGNDELAVGQVRAISKEEEEWVLKFYKKNRVVKKKSFVSKKNETTTTTTTGDSYNTNGYKQKASRSTVNSNEKGGSVTKEKEADSKQEEESRARGKYTVLGKNKEKINIWQQGSLGKGTSRRFQ